MPANRLQRTGSSFLPFTPARDLEDMENRISRFFRDPLGNFFMPTLTNEFIPANFAALIPPVEISETEMEFMLKAEIPGMMKKDINIDYERGVLMIRGEKFEEKKEEENRRYHLIETKFGSFNRSFTFPETIDAEKISADFKDGVLMIHLPKTEEARKPRGRKIEISDKA